MIIDNLDQNSPEWFAMRCGMCTASRVAAVIAKRKKGDGELAKRAEYRWELVLERLTGLSAEHFVSQPMKWGSDYEPLARQRYVETTGNTVTPIGFAIHDRLKWFGASPDSLVNDDGVLEIKCPMPGTHLQYLVAGIVPPEYVPQMMAEMACSGREWADFVSFDPRVPKKYQLFIRRLKRDDKVIAEMEAAVEAFLAEVDACMKRLEACDPLSDDLTGILKESLKGFTHGNAG